MTDGYKCTCNTWRKSHRMLQMNLVKEVLMPNMDE
jgi:hypothetical protein